MKSLRNLISRGTNKDLGNEETSMTENLNEFYIAVGSSCKQHGKKSNKGKNRPLQIEGEEDTEVVKF